MIKLAAASLSTSARKSLRQWQQHVDAAVDFASRVEKAKTTFQSRNRRGNPTFDEVRSRLSEMCCGAVRCMYCEDSAANEVEHLAPKRFYPDRVFVWENYLYSCGPCNGTKREKYAVFARNGRCVTLSRRSPRRPPPDGVHVLIDPRSEDPLEFLELDLIDTFFFLPRQLDGKANRRARFTIDVLKLNDRDLLPKARREAYGSYRARLVEYLDARRNGRARGDLDRRWRHCRE